MMRNAMPLQSRNVVYCDKMKIMIKITRKYNTEGKVTFLPQRTKKSFAVRCNQKQDILRISLENYHGMWFLSRVVTAFHIAFEKIYLQGKLSFVIFITSVSNSNIG